MYLMVSTHLEKLHIVLLMSFTKCKEKVGTWITQLCNALKRKNQPAVLAKTARQMAQGLTKVCSSGDEEEGRDDGASFGIFGDSFGDFFDHISHFRLEIGLFWSYSPVQTRVKPPVRGYMLLVVPVARQRSLLPLRWPPYPFPNSSLLPSNTSTIIQNISPNRDNYIFSHATLRTLTCPTVTSDKECSMFATVGDLGSAV